MKTDTVLISSAGHFPPWPKRVRMPLSLNIDVEWSDGRKVHVRCTGVPYLPTRGDRPIEEDDVVPLFELNVESRKAAVDFLTEATRFAADGAVLRVSGIEDDVRRLAIALGVYGPPPARIVVRVPAP
jgi:hypothetical protein